MSGQADQRRMTPVSISVSAPSLLICRAIRWMMISPLRHLIISGISFSSRRISMGRFDYTSVSLEGTNIIEASAGTGKTYSLAGIFLRLVLEEKNLPVDKILVVTFTDAATNELRDRIRQRLVDARRALSAERFDELPLDLQNDYIKECFLARDSLWRQEAVRRAGNAVICFDESSISTIHSFCQRVLRENAFEYGSLFNAELVPDQGPILEEILNDFIRRRLYSMDTSLVDEVKDIFLGQSLHKAMRQAMAKPLADLLPETMVPETSLIAVRKDVIQTFESSAKIWNADRSGIMTILSTSASLGKKFNGSAPGYCELVDACIAGGSPFAGLDDKCRYLGSAYLDEKCEGKEAVVHSFFDAWQSFLDALERVSIIRAGYEASVCVEFITYARKELSRRKAARNIWSFDDLLSRVYEGLSGADGIKVAQSVRSRFSAALIDEFQDTDSMQCRIFDSIFNTDGSVLFYIGDPKQAIYSFRGADIYAYQKARGSVRNSFFLDINRRSDEGVLRSVNALFSVPDPFLSEITYQPACSDEKERLMTEHGERAAGCVIWTVEGRDEKTLLSKGSARPLVAAAVAEEIARILSASDAGTMTIDGKKIRPGDIAVLVEMNFHCDAVRDELSRRGIPSVSNDNRSIYESEECTDLERFIKAVSDHTYIPAALVSSLIGLEPFECAAMIADDESWNDVLAEFASYSKLWDEGGFMRMFREFLSRRQILSTRVSGQGGVRAVTNILHCAECIHRAAAEKGLSRQGVLQWLADVREDPTMGIEPELRLETDDEAVSIVTVHKSKGLEYPIVFVPFTWDSPGVKKDSPMSYHDAEGSQVIDCTRDGGESFSEHFCAAEYERLSEQLRLLYVAMTRAKYRCYLTVGCIGRKGYNEGYPVSAVSYLLHGEGLGLSRETGVLPLRKAVEAMPSADLHSTLASRLSSARDVCRIEPIPEGFTVWTRDAAAGTKTGKERSPLRQLRDDWKISSFSYITAGSVHGYESRLDESHDDGRVQTEGFPAGADAGSCLHEILEKTPFSVDEPALRAQAQRSLASFGIDSQHLDAACALVRSTMNASLGSGIVLSKIPDTAVLKEMEFYFPAAGIDAQGLYSLFSRHASSFSCGETDSLSSLSFQEFSGFLKGFIDCFFVHEGKYYIIDWKSNWLGTDPSAYESESLGRAMDHHRYTLQGYIYALAVHRYLSVRIPGYTYESMFGGVYYLFMRGIDPARDGNGVWFSRPSSDFMADLERFFIRNTEAVK
jgi:exodeoxyribonuclease V beta subunit